MKYQELRDKIREAFATDELLSIINPLVLDHCSEVAANVVEMPDKRCHYCGGSGYDIDAPRESRTPCTYCWGRLDGESSASAVKGRIKDNKLIDFVLTYFKDVVGPFRTYTNPMRTDGVFVGQDIPPTPYKGLSTVFGHPVYPAVPQGVKTFPRQLPHGIANEVVRLLNERTTE